VAQRHKSFPLAALRVAIIDPVSKSLLGKDGQTNKHPIVAETQSPSLIGRTSAQLAPKPLR
jgi:hypothetical protein